MSEVRGLGGDIVQPVRITKKDRAEIWIETLQMVMQVEDKGLRDQLLAVLEVNREVVFGDEKD